MNKTLVPTNLINLYLTKKYPISLIHFLTNRCNARCPFCFIDFDNKHSQSAKNEMSLEQIDQFTKSLGPSLQHVNLTGGEPFLKKEIFDIVSLYFNNAKLDSILINTNGSLPKLIKKFINRFINEYPNKKCVFVFSIDAENEKHDEIRKIPGLFKKVIESCNIVKGYTPNAHGVVNLTCTLDNYNVVCSLYDNLIDKYNITCFSPIIVRDEGVYKIPEEDKKTILKSYSLLTTKIINDLKSGRIQGFDDSLMGRYLNAKNQIQYDIIKNTYLEQKFESYCPAGSIFGVIMSDGTVFPCEVLDKPLGNLKDYDYDFLKLWFDSEAINTKKWIKDTKCNCHWECAWTYNILSNVKYVPKLVNKML